MITTKRDVNLDAVFYSGSRARTSNLNMYAHNEPVQDFPQNRALLLLFVRVAPSHGFTQASIKPFVLDISIFNIKVLHCSAWVSKILEITENRKEYYSSVVAS